MSQARHRQTGWQSQVSTSTGPALCLWRRELGGNRAFEMQTARRTLRITGGDMYRKAIVAGAMLLLVVSLTGPSSQAQVTIGSRPVVQGGITDKPYLKNFTGGVALGGYMDHEFFMTGETSTFTSHRFIPFIFAQPVDYIHVTAEIEFEYGGFVRSGTASGNDTDGDGEINTISNSTTDGEIKLEFAFMDWVISDALNVRGGVLLTPLGKFNLIHDSPLNDLTNRPIVSRQLLPTTLSESGMGIFGAFYPEDWVVGYELYLVNGFNHRVIDGSKRLRVRGGRGSHKTDNNENKAITGRVSVSPALGVDVGVSGHHGKYDVVGEHDLSIAALDVDVQRGPVQFIGEGAMVSADVAEGTPTAESQMGFYAQVGYHFGFGAIRRYPEGVFTAVARWDLVDYDRDRDGDDEQMATIGLNMRPVEGTVVKVDYSWNWMRGVGGTVWSEPNTLFSFSLATYF